MSNPIISPAVSIIVPVFNAEKTISKALDSLVNQTLPNYEIICVDDGSTDSSLDIMKHYAGIFNNIHVISSQNSGSYHARLLGISKSHGKYIGFCDADDTAEPDMYEKLYNLAKTNNADLVVSAYKRIQSMQKNTFRIEMINFNNHVFSVNHNSGWLVAINTSLWNKLIRSDIAKKCIQLSKPPHVTEDALFLLSIYPDIQQIAFTTEPLYNYYVNQNSAMSSFSSFDLSDLIYSWRATKQFVLEKNARFEKIVDLLAFIHLGLSIALITINTNKKKSESKYIRSALRHCLNHEFKTYKYSIFVKLPYTKTYNQLRKVAIGHKAYRIHAELVAFKTLRFIKKTFLNSNGLW